MYYQQTPISEKPETDNWYIMVADSAIPVIRWFDNFYGWDISEIGHGYQHWLKPITGVVMTEEEFKRLYDGIVQNVGTSVKKSDMPTWKQVLEMIKRDRIH